MCQYQIEARGREEGDKEDEDRGKREDYVDTV
jgi:hypothetical protein